MNNQDEILSHKLDTILKSSAAVQVNYDADSRDDYDKLIPAIKQAFIDANWLPIAVPIKKYLDAGGNTDYIVISRRDAENGGYGV